VPATGRPTNRDERTPDLLEMTERSNGERANRVIFIHIPKAAGQTVNSIVARQYPRDQILHVKGSVGEARVLNSVAASRAKLVTGHVHFGVHREFHGASSYMTMLRDPVSRVLSLYRYIVSKPQHTLHSRVADIGLMDFVAGSADAEEIENGQTRQIAGVTSGAPDAGTLALAKRNLKEHFVVVGLLERFDESVLLFKRRLRWKMPYYVPKNVAADIPPEEPSADAIEVIQRRNTLDADLYRYAADLFEEELLEEGPLFPIELSAFRLLNPVARIYKGIRNLARV
jgi:Sulfotransferase family